MNRSISLIIFILIVLASFAAYAREYIWGTAGAECIHGFDCDDDESSEVIWGLPPTPPTPPSGSLWGTAVWGTDQW
jgi:hypothetical protein